MKCFDTWRIFSRLLLHDESSTVSLLRYRQTINSPKSALSTYTTPLTSSTFHFITLLSITAPFTVPEMVQLAHLKNLGVLEVASASSQARVEPEDMGFSTVNDRVIHSWSQSALEDGAFRILRALKLCGHSDLTSSSLMYINTFPALILFEVQDCNFGQAAISQAADLGWVGWSNDEETCENVMDALVAYQRGKVSESGVGQTSRTIFRPCTQQVWDGSAIDWAARKVVSEGTMEQWMHDTTISSGMEDDPAATRLLPNNRNALEPLSEMESFEMRDHKLFLTTSARGTWDLASYYKFHLIGQLRDDEDLAAVSVNIDPQPHVSGTVLCSAPITIVRLGPESTLPHPLPWGALQSSSAIGKDPLRVASTSFQKRKVPGFVFIHKQLLLEQDKAMPDSNKPTPATCWPGTASKLHGRKRNQTKSTFKTKKKQKLENVLGLFE